MGVPNTTIIIKIFELNISINFDISKPIIFMIITKKLLPQKHFKNKMKLEILKLKE